MKKRTFLKMSSAVLTGAVLSPLAGCRKSEPTVVKAERLKNWAGNLEYSTENVAYPESVEQVQAFVKKTDKFRTLGTRHCFNKIADSPHQLLSTKNLDKVIALDTAKNTVTVEGGIRYGTLGECLLRILAIVNINSGRR